MWFSIKTCMLRGILGGQEVNGVEVDLSRFEGDFPIEIDRALSNGTSGTSGTSGSARSRPFPPS